MSTESGERRGISRIKASIPRGLARVDDSKTRIDCNESDDQAIRQRQPAQTTATPRRRAAVCAEQGHNMKVINLGWGIQSFTLAAMVALGELEPVDAAIHADTTHERSATYDFARCWTPWLQERGVNVVTVGDPEQAAKAQTQDSEAPFFTVKTQDDYGGVFIPAHSDTDRGGMLRRQCTNRWKIQPIRRWLQAQRLRRLEIRIAQRVFYGLEPKYETLEPVEQWLGISLDEAERMKPSDVKYITHRWPLIERRMSRNDCIAWLGRHDLEIPVKSACVFCPYHNRRAWWDMKRENGADWQKAVKVDEAIRKARPPYDLFVHPDLIPLRDVKSPMDHGQLEMFSEECSGYCFI